MKAISDHTHSARQGAGAAAHEGVTRQSAICSTECVQCVQYEKRVLEAPHWLALAEAINELHAELPSPVAERVLAKLVQQNDREIRYRAVRALSSACELVGGTEQLSGNRSYYRAGSRRASRIAVTALLFAYVQDSSKDDTRLAALQGLSDQVTLERDFRRHHATAAATSAPWSGVVLFRRLKAIEAYGTLDRVLGALYTGQAPPPLSEGAGSLNVESVLHVDLKLKPPAHSRLIKKVQEVIVAAPFPCSPRSERLRRQILQARDPQDVFWGF